MGRSRVSGRVWRRSREVGAGCRTAHGCEHSYANPGTGRGFERVRRALRRLRPRCLQPCLPADRGLVDGRGRDGRDLHGGVAPAGQGRPGGRFPAAVAAGHRHQHRAQPVPEQPAVPGGGAGGRGGRTVGARPRRGGRGPPRRSAAPRAGAHGPGVTAPSGARGHRALPGGGPGLRGRGGGARHSGRYGRLPPLPCPQEAPQEGRGRPGPTSTAKP